MDLLYRVEHDGEPRHAVQRDGAWHLLEGDAFGEYSIGRPLSSSGVDLLAPVQPSKIVAIGFNYRDHAAELGKELPTEPLVFMKPSTAVIGPGARIVMPTDVGRVDYEAELGVVVGKRAYRVKADEASRYILGLTCVNDVTARDLQQRDVQFTRCKGFDTFAPIGPCVALGLHGSELDIEGWVNGTRRQASNTRELIFGVEYLMEFVTAVMTLLPGDIIATGTPFGVGSLQPGDRVLVKVEGVGELVNEVVARS